MELWNKNKPRKQKCTSFCVYLSEYLPSFFFFYILPVQDYAISFPLCALSNLASIHGTMEQEQESKSDSLSVCIFLNISPLSSISSLCISYRTSTELFLSLSLLYISLLSFMELQNKNKLRKQKCFSSVCLYLSKYLSSFFYFYSFYILPDQC